MSKRQRKETGYRHVESVNGTYSPHIPKEINERLSRYCKSKNLNKTEFVNYCIEYILKQKERELYEEMSREELIDRLMERNYEQLKLQL